MPAFGNRRMVRRNHVRESGAPGAFGMGWNGEMPTITYAEAKQRNQALRRKVPAQPRASGARLYQRSRSR